MKTATQHTPGPWTLTAPEDRAGWTIESTDCKIAHLYLYGASTGGPRTKGEPSANARLIAAAPELLAALRECRAIVCLQNGNLHDDINEIIERATAAIRKAEGE